MKLSPKFIRVQFVPELKCEWKIHRPRTLPPHVVEQELLLRRCIVRRREREVPLPDRGHEDLRDAGEDAALRRHVDVVHDAGEE